MLTVYKNKEGALAAFVLAAYMDGVPMIYSSQEVGYPNTINFFNIVPVDYCQRIYNETAQLLLPKGSASLPE